MKFWAAITGPIVLFVGGVATGIFGAHEIVGAAMILVGGVALIVITNHMIMAQLQLSMHKAHLAEETKREAAGREHFMRYAPPESDAQSPIPGLDTQV